MGLWIKETFVNATDNRIFGEGPWIETEHTNRAALKRELASEYGRATNMGLDVPGRGFVGSHTVYPAGWVFTQRSSFEDDPKHKYTREVWVTVRDAPPSQYDRRQGRARARRRAGRRASGWRARR